jgi:hypothetical protein
MAADIMTTTHRSIVRCHTLRGIHEGMSAAILSRSSSSHAAM